MFSEGAQPFNSPLASLYGGATRRRAWLNSVRSGRVKRDSHGRFLPRSGRRRKTTTRRRKRRYSASAYDVDVPAPDITAADVYGKGYGVSQRGVDQASMNLRVLKRKWDEIMDSIDPTVDFPPPTIYPIARKIVRNLAYIKRAEKLMYYPLIPPPQFSATDSSMIIGLVNGTLDSRPMYGPEYERQIALELAAGDNDQMGYPERKERIRRARKSARAKLSKSNLGNLEALMNLDRTQSLQSQIQGLQSALAQRATAGRRGAPPSYSQSMADQLAQAYANLQAQERANMEDEPMPELEGVYSSLRVKTE